MFRHGGRGGCLQPGAFERIAAKKKKKTDSPVCIRQSPQPLLLIPREDKLDSPSNENQQPTALWTSKAGLRFPQRFSSLSVFASQPGGDRRGTRDGNPPDWCTSSSLIFALSA